MRHEKKNNIIGKTYFIVVFITTIPIRVEMKFAEAQTKQKMEQTNKK